MLKLITVRFAIEQQGGVLFSQLKHIEANKALEAWKYGSIEEA